jgi:hypothetical protein
LFDLIRYRKRKLNFYIGILSGLVLTLLVYEAFRLSILGVGEYVKWWNFEISSILKQSGVKAGFSDTPNHFKKILLHSTILAKYLKIPIYILWIYLVLPYVILNLLFYC